MTWKNEWNAAPRAERIALGFVASAALLNLLLAFFNYPVIGHDAYVHLNWLEQFPRLFSSGIFYPRWLPDSFGGFGAPTFYFYPPLVYWIASVFYVAGIHSPQGLYQLVQVLFSVLSVITSYALLKQLGGNRIRSLSGTLLFSFLAYRFCDVYIRDALTEHAALVFFPLLFLRSKDRFRSVALIALGWIGLFLTNLPIAYLSIFSVTIILIAKKNRKEVPLHLFAFALGVAISAVYLFPAFGLRGLIHQRHLFDLPMHTSEWGFALLDLFQGHFDWLRILSIATIISTLLFLSNDGWRSEWKWLLAVGLFFQIPFVSAPFWHLIPGMPFVQFSWRWNGILLLAIGAMFSKNESRTMLMTCVIIGLSVVTIISGLTIARNLFSRPPLPINAFHNDAPEYAPKWAANDPSEVIGITLRRMNDSAAVLLGLTMPDDTLQLERKTSTEWDFVTHLQRATPVRFHRWFWPQWKLFRDSTEIPIVPDANGFTTAELPAGNYHANLILEKSSAEKVGAVTSVFGLLCFLGILGITIYRSITKRPVRTSEPAETRRI